MHNGKSHETRQEKLKSNIQLTLTQSRLRRLPSVDIFFHMIHLKLIVMHHTQSDYRKEFKTKFLFKKIKIKNPN